MTPFLEKYGNQIIWSVCALLLVAAGTILWVRSSSRAASAGWARLAVATQAEDFAKVAEDYPNTAVGAWARLQEAESLLRSGIELLFVHRSAAQSDLQQAKDSFETVLRNKAAPPEVRERALFGVARCLESLADHNTQPAVEAYQRLLSEFPETVYKQQAEDRITDLQTEQAKEFYAWFHQQNPKPPDRSEPQDGTPILSPPQSPSGNESSAGDQNGTTGNAGDAAGSPGTSTPKKPSTPKESSTEKEPSKPDQSSAEKSPSGKPGSASGGPQFPRAEAPDTPRNPPIKPPEEGDTSDRPNSSPPPK